MPIKLLPFFSSVPVAAILDFKMAAIFNIFWPTSQLLSYLESSKGWQNLYFLMIWIAIKVLRKLLVIFLLAAILDFKMAAIFNIFRPSYAPEGVQNGGKPKFIMQKDIIKAHGKLLVVVLLVAIFKFKMAAI